MKGFSFCHTRYDISVVSIVIFKKIEPLNSQRGTAT